MISSDLNDIMHRLPHLSAHELDKLYDRVKALRSMSADSSPTKQANDPDVVLDIIARVLRSVGADFSNVRTLQRSRSYPSFKEKVPDLMNWLQTAALNRIEQCAILEIAVRLLYHEIKRWPMPITDQLVMNSINRIPAVVNLHFPGYAKHGMLKMLVKR